jgi:antitoxin FitA
MGRFASFKGWTYWFSGKPDLSRLAGRQEIFPMARVLVNDLDAELFAQLKARARLHGRSLQGELKAILEAAAVFSMAEAKEASARWRQRLAGRTASDSSELIREDRER